MEEINVKQKYFEKRWFFFLFIYLVVEFLRIHELLHIGFLRPGMLLTLILALFVFINGNFAFIFKRQIKLIIFFVLLLVLFVPLARNNYWAFQTAKAMVILIPPLLSIVALINTRERIRSLFWIFSILLAYNAVYGILHEGRGPGSFVEDENDLGLFLITFLPFLFFLLGQSKKKYSKFFLFGIVCLSLTAVVATFSRGAFVGLLAMGFIYWWYGKNKIKLAIFVVILGIVFSVYTGEKYMQEMSTITDTGESTAVSRMLSWETGWCMFLDNPLGVGGGNFPVRFDEYQPEEFNRSMWGRVAHSLWFTLIPETGIVGILLYFSIIGYNLKDIFLLRRLSEKNLAGHHNGDTFFFSFSTALLASLAGFFASATFLSVLYYPQFWILTAIIAATRNVGGLEIAQPVNADFNRGYT